MVEIERIKNKIEELDTFFKEVIIKAENTDNSSFGAGAEYGLDCLDKMKKSLTAYQEKPSNKHLKDIYFGFTAVTRGVEGFNNFNLEMRFRAASNGIYTIQEELHKNIKW